MPVSQKNEYLFQRGINFNELPNWQKRGIGIYWEKYEKKGYNPITCETVSAIRNRLKVDLDLPMKDQYSDFILILLNSSQGDSEPSHPRVQRSMKRATSMTEWTSEDEPFRYGRWCRRWQWTLPPGCQDTRARTLAKGRGEYALQSMEILIWKNILARSRVILWAALYGKMYRWISIQKGSNFLALYGSQLKIIEPNSVFHSDPLRRIFNRKLFKTIRLTLRPSYLRSKKPILIGLAFWLTYLNGVPTV